MNTEVKIIKYSESESKISYRLYVDGIYQDKFDAIDEATREAEAIIIELKNGYPKSETVFRENVEHL